MSSDTKQADPILLSLFGQRFMAIAEAMGRSLQQVSQVMRLREDGDYRGWLI